MREREVFFKDLCQRKDKEYQDLAYVQVQGIEECQRLRSDLEEKDKILGRLTADNQRLQDEALRCTPAQSPSIKQLLKRWKREAKSTRDWTKCNQLIGELEKLVQ